jgi:hypothetical protein
VALAGPGASPFDGRPQSCQRLAQVIIGNLGQGSGGARHDDGIDAAPFSSVNPTP